MNMIRREKKDWYVKNISKLIILFSLLIFFAFVINFVPYFNIFFSFPVASLFLFVLWYVLFTPSFTKLILAGIIMLLLACISSLFGLEKIGEVLGNLIYLLFIFLFIMELKYNI